MIGAAPDRVAIYGLENHQGTPTYVHAKTCIVDDVWSTVGSDNFNRRSWTHDSELTVAIMDDEPRGEPYSRFARSLRLTLAAEHLDREVDPSSGSGDRAEQLLEAVGDCVEPEGMFEAFAKSAEALDGWHRGGQVGDRPPGRLRRMLPPELGPLTRAAASVPYFLLHDPDGRPRPIRRTNDY
jgi:phosphatidylserine/phosphatidylglycerophosphate/cardiolipin synthase-like enzyme